MKELLKEYQKTLNKNDLKIQANENRIKKIKDTFQNAHALKVSLRKAIDLNKELKIKEQDLVIFKAAKSDLQFTTKWIKTGIQPDAHWRGIEKNDAYYISRSYDPYMMGVLIENRQANKPFEMIEENFLSVEEKEEQERIRFDDSLNRDTAELFEQAKEALTRNEIRILLFLQEERSQSEIAELIGVSQQAISKRIKSIKKKLSKIGIERDDL